MPTGSGKSLCFQLPALIFSGLTVVASPLIALMEDQVMELRELGVPAVYLNSTLSYQEYLETKDRIQAGEIRLVYAAPETLLRLETILLLQESGVDLFVIDEAHCISEWGHDFRPEYRKLAELRQGLPEATTLAMTATATKRVQADIKDSLGILRANQFISSFNRPNLFLAVSSKHHGVYQVMDFLDQHRNEAGIIYCSTRKMVDQLAEILAERGYPALPYHTGMEDGERRANQRRFWFEDGLIMVATIAFGMGINKSNVRFIIHHDLPENLERYYQQIGRAGRDGLAAECLLLYSYHDLITIQRFIEKQSKELRAESYARLGQMLAFAQTQECRRKPLLTYFGEHYDSCNCEMCDNCVQTEQEAIPEPTAVTLDEAPVDLSAPARLLLACVHEVNQRFGMDHIIKILRGSRSKKVLGFKHDQLDAYGTGKMYNEREWRALVAQFIELALVTQNAYGSLKITGKGKAVLKGERVLGKAISSHLVGRLRAHEQAYDRELYEKLQELRGKIAKERGLPPYVIFHDRTLIEMSTYFPDSPDSFAMLNGVGGHKVEQYANSFLAVIRGHCNEKGVASKPIPKPDYQDRTTPRTQQVWELHRAGKPLSEMKAELGVHERTITAHLYKAIQAGKLLNLDGLLQMTQYSWEDGQFILAAFEERGCETLRPVFEALEEKVPFNDLHVWRMICLTVNQEAQAA